MNEQGSMSLEEASAEVLSQLSAELEPLKGEILTKNPNAKLEEVLQRYIEYLKSIKDPRISLIDSLLKESVAETEADQVVEVFVAQSQSRLAVLDLISSNAQIEKQFNGHSFNFAQDLIQSLDQFDERDLINFVSQKQYPKLSIAIYTAVVSNIALMTAEHSQITAPAVEQIYQKLHQLSFESLSGDQVVGLTVISLFFTEMALKVKNLGLIPYLKYNKLDASLNVLGAAELGFIASDLMGAKVDFHAASVLRSLRALRLLKILHKIPSVRQLSDSVAEVSPKFFQVAGAYAGFSFINMVILMELVGRHIPEFNSIGSTLNEMRNLFFADGFQDSILAIENSDSIDVVSKTIASLVANGHMLISNLMYAAIPTALLADAFMKSGERAERMLAMALEKLVQIRDEIRGVRQQINQLLDNHQAKTSK